MKSIINICLGIVIILLSSQTNGVNETLDQKLWYQYELEKLAMDYYDAMYEKWDVIAFRNLSRSEKRHMECLELLMEEIGNPDLIKPMEVGKFMHKELQDLYNKVMVLGNESLNKAFIASANLEEKNIKDIEAMMEMTDNEDALFSFDKLLENSKCHLNVMVCQLKNKGIGYKPVLLTLNEYIDCLEATPGDINAKLTDCPEMEYDCPFKDN